MANLRDSLQMAYLFQLYRQENSLKCRLRSKLLIDDSKLFDLVQPWNILADVDLPTSRAQFFSQVRGASGRLFMFSAVKASQRARALLVSPAKKIESSEVILARISSFPEACVVACVCSLELSKFVEANR